MNIPQLARQVEKFAIDNSPALLTGIGVTGVVVTAVLTGRATIKAHQIVVNEEVERHGLDFFDPSYNIEPMPAKEVFNLVWKSYIPPILMGASTIAAVVAANQIGTKRAAAMAAAYTLSKEAFDEYKAKVVEKLGDKKEEAVRAEIAQDRVDRKPIGAREIIITGRGAVNCLDNYSGRYFKTSMEELKSAQNNLNHKINNNWYASLNDFYDLIGLGGTRVGEEVGWNSDELLDLDIQTTTDENQEPCFVIDFNTVPIRKFHRVH